ncbi:hypothetical protein PR002_g20504 [Phytophthora rubi]|uniref:Uncharacterized protein n=1 Tax=Phytophthora rubi TaxID=129364 RepID=A0A6A3JGC8_9STRA|nr:hypothetical protein PR002_g20504 [Phytophthora rubi]
MRGRARPGEAASDADQGRNRQKGVAVMLSDGALAKVKSLFVLTVDTLALEELMLVLTLDTLALDEQPETTELQGGEYRPARQGGKYHQRVTTTQTRYATGRSYQLW